MNRRFRTLLLLLALCAVTGMVMAQRYRGRVTTPANPRDMMEGDPLPDWGKDKELPTDVFTFARVIYSSGGGGWGRRGWGGGGWRVDYPDADLNLSYRLQQLTSWKTHPDGILIELTDPALFDYPFIYIIEPGSLEFDDAEVTALRRYLLNGGFLLIDDFWGQEALDNMTYELKRVLPDTKHTPQELPVEHPIFNKPLPIGRKPQLPNYRTGEQSQYTGITWEDHGPNSREPHYQAIFDDKGRIMVLMCHNTDTGDGWEREGVYHYYFKEFSEKYAYPLAINILFYTMTH